MLRLANEHEPVVAVPLVVEPVQVHLAVRTVTVQVEHVRVAVEVLPRFVRSAAYATIR